MDGENINLGANTTGAWTTGQLGETAPTETKTVDKSTEASPLHITESTIKQSDIKPPVKDYRTDPGRPLLPEATFVDPHGGLRTLERVFDYPVILQQLATDKQQPPEQNSSAAKYQQSLIERPVQNPDIIKLAVKEGVSPGEAQNGVEIQASIYFKQELDKLPPDVALKLKFASMMPNGRENLSPELKVLYDQITATVTNKLIQDYGFPQEWEGVTMGTPKDVEQFAEKISNEYDANFQQALKQYAADNNLSQADVNTLKILHFMPDADVPSNPTLLNILKSLNGTAATQVQQKYGLDASVELTPNSNFYKAVATGAFVSEFKDALDNQKPPLTKKDREQIERYLQNPKDPTVPQSIKDLVDSLKATIIPRIASKYGMGDDWDPGVNTLEPPDGVNAIGLDIASTAIQTADEVVATASAEVQSMPESPEQANYLNFLKAIGEALDQLQDSIYAMQSTQSSVSQALSKGNLDMQLNSIEKQQRAAEEAKKKEGKMAKMGPLGDILTWVTNITIIAFSVLGGPAAMAIAITYVVETEKAKASGEKSIFQDMFASITEAIGPEAGIFVNALIATLLSCGNPILLMTMLQSDTRTIQDIIGVCGGDEAQQEMGAAITWAIIQVAIMVAVVILTAGAAAPAAAAATTGAVTSATAQAVATGLKITAVAVSIIVTAMSIAASGIELNNAIIQIEISKLKSVSEAYAEEVAGIIDSIKKLIQKLLALLNGNSDWIVDINTFQGQKYTDASTISSQLSS